MSRPEVEQRAVAGEDRGKKHRKGPARTEVTKLREHHFLRERVMWKADAKFSLIIAREAQCWQ